MAKDPAYPMYAQDFDMDTADWGIDEIGVYIRLLNYEWINGYVPNNLGRISKIARISPRKLQKIWEIISKKFSPNGTHTLQNKRMEEEREKRNKYIESQRKSGKKGAEKRWKGHSEPNSDPIGKPNGGKIALHSSSSSSSSSSNIKDIYIAVFNIWNDQNIIRHKNKTEAMDKAIKKALKDYSQDEISVAIKNYAIVCTSEKHYFSHKWCLADFLNRGLVRFLDEADPLNNYKTNKAESSLDISIFDDIKATFD